MTRSDIQNYFETLLKPLDVDYQEERTTYPLRDFGPN